MGHQAFVNLVRRDDDGFDEEQIERAIAQSLAGADMQPARPQQKPSIYEDDDLQRALAESMRTFEAEQHAAGGQAGKKRSSSSDATDAPELQEQQGQQQPHHSAPAGDQCSPGLQQTASGGTLKRQRSSSMPGHASLGVGAADAVAPAQVQARFARQGAVVTTSLQQAVQPLRAVQRSATVTDATRMHWPSRGILQPLQQQLGGGSSQEQQGGLGRSFCVQDLQGLVDGDEGPAASQELAGSRPSSPAVGGLQQQQYQQSLYQQQQYQQQQYQQYGGGGGYVGDAEMEDDDLLPELQADDEDDMLGACSDSSISSIAHESGLPHTVSTWGPALLQAAHQAQQQAASPPLAGPGPVPGDSGEWCIHCRQLYPGQPIWWQESRNSFSFPGRVLAVEGAGSSGRVQQAAVYTAELAYHPLGLTYVEASANQLHPQLRVGEIVWCKPGAAKRDCWSHTGAVYRLHHLLGASGVQPTLLERCGEPWVLGTVLQTQTYQNRNPIAEVSLGPEDTCWFRNSQIELVREIGESSATAEARWRPPAAPEAEQPAAAAAAAAPAGAVSQDMVMEDQAGVQEVQSQQQQQQPGSQSQQQQQQPASQEQSSQQQQQQQADDALLQSHQAASPQHAPPPVTEQLVHDAAPGLAAPAGSPESAAGGTEAAAGARATTAADEASPDPAAAAAPSLLSRPLAAVTAESELEAAARAASVEQEAGAAAGLGQQEQQQELLPLPLGPAAVAKAATVAGAVQAAGNATSQQQQQQQQQGAPPVLEGTGESIDALPAEEGVADSCAALEAGEGGGEGAGGVGPALSPKQPLSNQASGVEDHNRARPAQEGFGET